MRRPKITLILVLVLLAVAVFAISYALAQPAQQRQGQARMFMPTAGSVAANSDYVYVIWMGTLYQFDAKTLAKVKEVQLPRPQPGQFGPGGGQFGPGGGQFGPGAE